MVKTLTRKNVLSMIPILLFCWGIGGFALWRYGMGALGLLQGRIRPSDLDESVSNYYGMSALALFFIVIGLIIVIRQLVMSIGKRIDKYIAEHPGVSLQMLEEDFAGAEQFGAIWVGQKYTYSTDLSQVLLENNRIVLICEEEEYQRRRNVTTTSYYICWCMADGKEFRVRVDGGKLRKLKEYYARFPHILTENNPEFKRLFRNNLSGLLNIKYNENIQQ